MTFSFKNIEDSVAAILWVCYIIIWLLHVIILVLHSVESSAVCLGDLDKNIPSEYKVYTLS